MGRVEDFPGFDREVFGLRAEDFPGFDREVFGLRAEDFPGFDREVFGVRAEDFPGFDREVFGLRAEDFPGFDRVASGAMRHARAPAPQVLKADPAYRRRILALLAVAGLVGAATIHWGLPAVDAWLQGLDHVSAKRVVRIFVPVAFLPFAAYGIVLLRVARRIRRAGRHPLPGARVAVDTRVLEGAAAHRLALRLTVGGVLVAAISLAGAAYGYYVLGRLLEKPSKDNNMATRETKTSPAGPDIDALWEYSQPEASEARFRQSLGTLQGDARLETLTQIARTLSLRGRFPEAHRLLDEIEPQLAAAGLRPRIRYLLERGRTFNSAGEKERARGLFLEAWKDARGTEVGLAADAAHMVAITYSGTAHAVEWNHRGLALARSSPDPKARALVPALLNNQAWDLHAMGRFGDALRLFEEALQEWTARGMPERIRIARWSVARCLRSLGRHEEALAMQRSLEAEHAAAGTSDPHVLEEIEALLRALGRG